MTGAVKCSNSGPSSKRDKRYKPLTPHVKTVKNPLNGRCEVNTYSSSRLYSISIHVSHFIIGVIHEKL